MYAVFGVCRAEAERQAKKIVPAVVAGVTLTLDEYTGNLVEETDRLFEKLKPKKLSSVFANKREAQHYLNLARAAGMKDLVMKRAVENERGICHKVSGKCLLEWRTLY